MYAASLLVFSLVYLFMQARVNIPSISARTLRRDIAGSAFSTGAEIQVSLDLFHAYITNALCLILLCFT